MKLNTIFERAKNAYPKTVRIVRSDWQLLPVMCSADNIDRLVLVEFPHKQEPVTHRDFTITVAELEQQGGQA